MAKEKRDKVIMEIRAGAGGEEAMLFAKDLARMYEHYGQGRGWLIKKPQPLILEITGQDVYKHLKYEAGVHRVQRVPTTEKYGRIHTSTATVAVLSQTIAPKIKIKPENLKIDTFRASGPGGQRVNKVSTAVRVTHLPTGIVVSCQDERSQAKNKLKALKILKDKLTQKERQKKEMTISQARREQVGEAERSEKIRTYNFGQNRVTDHRIKKSFKDLARIMDGNLDKIIASLSKEAREGVN